MRIELQNVNTNKLHDELFKAGIAVTVESLDTITWVTVDDNEYSAVMGVVAIHNPIPLPKKKSELEILKETVDMLVLSSLGV